MRIADLHDAVGDDFLHNGALLGLASDNLYVRNPLVAEDFAAALRGGGNS